MNAKRPARILSSLFLTVTLAQAQAQQIPIPRIELLPDRPTPYALRDWGKTAHDLDALVFNPNAKGEYLPLIWRVPNVPNLDVPGFGMPSYVGKEEMRGRPAEAIAALGALLGGTAVGIDKRPWVELTPQYLNPSEGTILNNVGGKSGSSFWYELFPSVLFTQLASRYPDWSRGKAISKGIADAWIDGLAALDGNFDHTSFDFATRRPVDNGRWREPEAVAAVAYLELFQSLQSGESRYGEASDRALKSLESRKTNPSYEILTPYGALTAAYGNAAKGGKWNVHRLLDWCFEPNSPERAGWGMVAGRWGAHDVGGLMGSTTDGGGYAFAMNSFVSAATLAPVARYDDRYSAALAKWLLNVTSSARLFYRDSLPETHQSSAAWTGDPQASIAYEGLRRGEDGRSPYATGDAKRAGWAKEDFALYGGGYVGLLGALVRPTDVPMILRIDLRATDFLPVRGYPTELLWNPYDSAKSVRLDLGPTPVRLYDAVANRFLSKRPITGEFRLRLAPRQAIQVVQVPPKGAPTYEANRTLLAGIPIDFNNGRVPLPPRVEPRLQDESQAVRVPRTLFSGGEIELTGGKGSRMRAGLRFAWDDRYLRFRLEQRAPATETAEAPSLAELRKHWWDFEAVVLSFDFGLGRRAVANVPEVTVGWSSNGLANLAFSPYLDGVITTTSGSSASSNRVIEGRIPWADLYRATGIRKPLRDLLHPGLRIGCQPLLIDGTFRRQAYLNGTPYTRPTGLDRDSRTLVLTKVSG